MYHCNNYTILLSLFSMYKKNETDNRFLSKKMKKLLITSFLLLVWICICSFTINKNGVINPEKRNATVSKNEMRF
jgi:hypothetical protein